LRRIDQKERASPQKLVQQLLAGIGFLHSHGVVHGGKAQPWESRMRTQLEDVSKIRFTDPHMGNFGIAIPQLQQVPEMDVMIHFSDPVLTAVVPHDPFLSLESYPVYLTETSPLEDFIAAKNLLPPPEEMRLKIMDFG
jgi:hypothetical protein